MKTLLSKYKLKNLLYYIIILSGIVCNVATFVVELAVHGFYVFSLIFPIISVVFMVLGIVGLATGKTNVVIISLFVILDLIETPLVLYIYGVSSFPYLLLNLVVNALFLKGTSRKIVIPLTIMVYIGIAILINYHPQTVIDFKNNTYIPSVVSFFVVAAILLVISLVMISQYNTEMLKTAELEGKLELCSKRDSVTNVFTKQYADEYLTYMLENHAAFTVATFKISSYDRLISKYGEQFCDVGCISLVEILLKNASEEALITRYSKSTFIVIYNECETDNVKQSIRNIFDAISNGLSKNLDISTFVDNCEPHESLKTVLNRIAVRMNGFGD